jgi:hypothetical protein
MKPTKSLSSFLTLEPPSPSVEQAMEPPEHPENPAIVLITPPLALKLFPL